MTFDSIDDIQDLNVRTGRHFFDRETLRFFRSRILDGVYHGRYFVTSERDHPRMSRRRYTVREALEDGTMRTVGEFCQFETARQAIAFARKIEGGAR